MICVIDGGKRFAVDEAWWRTDAKGSLGNAKMRLWHTYPTPVKFVVMSEELLFAALAAFRPTTDLWLVRYSCSNASTKSPTTDTAYLQ